MTKIAYNACFGGFGMSPDAIKLGREISGNPAWGCAVLKGETYPDSFPSGQSFGGKVNRSDWGSYHPYCEDDKTELPRTDPVLTAVIEQMGARASGDCASLKIRELPVGTRYRIDEYDGNESVMTIDDYTWEVA